MRLLMLGEVLLRFDRGIFRRILICVGGTMGLSIWSFRMRERR